MKLILFADTVKLKTVYTKSEHMPILWPKYIYLTRYRYIPKRNVCNDMCLPKLYVPNVYSSPINRQNEETNQCFSTLEWINCDIFI